MNPLRGTASAKPEVLVPEMAHAWVRHNLDNENGSAIMALRGVEPWHDPDTERKLRGTEHVAEIIARDLNDDFRRPGLITDHETSALQRGFHFPATTPVVDSRYQSNEAPAPTETPASPTA